MTAFDPRTVHSTHPRYSGQPYAGQQFPGPVPPPPSRPARQRPRPLAAKIVAGLIAAGVVAGGAGTWIALSGPSSTGAAVQSTSFAGADPTTSPFGTDNPQVATVAATGQQAGDTTAMYAATTPPSCNNADFLSQLQADPNKLAAFGGVFGIGPGDVPAFVNSLSPVVLRAATSVTDHPFTDGAFVEQPAVLAAGTAVLVNSYGEPTVKCFNGNPLTGGNAEAGAVTVTPAPQAIATFQFTSIDNRGPVVVPGKPDPKPHPGPNPSPLSGRYDYDGTVLLSDGRIVTKDGEVVPPKFAIPAGGTRNTDGSVTVNGTTFNPDGTQRAAVVIPDQVHTTDIPGVTFTTPGFTITAGGVAVDKNNVPVNPQPKMIRNYDGSVTMIGTNNVEVWGKDGNISKFDVVPPNTINPDGSITTPDGIVNPDGSTKRTDVPLPDGGTEKANGGETPAAKKSLLNADGSLPEGASRNADGTKTDPATVQPCTPIVAGDTCPPPNSPAKAQSEGQQGNTTGGTTTAGTTADPSSSTSGSTTSGTSGSGSSKGSSSTGSSTSSGSSKGGSDK